MLLHELLVFFQAAASTGDIADKTIGELYSYVAIKSQSAAMAVAKIALNHKESAKKNQLLNDFLAKMAQPGNEVQASLCLGELGKRFV